jgi:hypothetical protein
MSIKTSALIQYLHFIVLCFFISSSIAIRIKPTTTTTKPTTTTKSIINQAKDQFKSNLTNFINATSKITLPKSRTIDRSNGQSNMRQTSNTGLLLNNVIPFIAQLESDLTSNDVPVSTFIVDASLCPYKNITCKSAYKYQSYDGSCNNLANPLFGMSNTPFQRLLKPLYDDGSNSVRNTSLTSSSIKLPNPRVLSLALSPPQSVQRLENLITHLFPIFGQFLTHDITGTSAITS